MNNALDLGVALNRGWNLFTKDAVAWIVGILAGMLISSVSMGLLAGPVMVGFANMALKANRGQTVEIGDAFSGFNQFGVSFVMGLLYLLAVGIGTLLCVLPGIFLAFSLVWAPYFIADDERDAVGALKRSHEFTMANLGPALIFVIVAGLVGGAGQALAGIGGLITMPICYLMMGVGYDRAFHATAAPATAGYETASVSGDLPPSV